MNKSSYWLGLTPVQRYRAGTPGGHRRLLTTTTFDILTFGHMAVELSIPTRCFPFETSLITVWPAFTLPTISPSTRTSNVQPPPTKPVSRTTTTAGPVVVGIGVGTVEQPTSVASKLRKNRFANFIMSCTPRVVLPSVNSELMPNDRDNWIIRAARFTLIAPYTRKIFTCLKGPLLFQLITWLGMRY